MGSSVTRASKVQQEAAKTATENMCESLEKAILEVAKLEGPDVSEAGVTQAAKKVVDICKKHAKRSTLKLVAASKQKDGEMGGSSDSDSGDVENWKKLIANLVVLKLLVELADDDSSGPDSPPDSKRASQEVQTIIVKPWKRKERLGTGAFGAVYSAVDKNGFKFAVKEVSRNGIEEKSLSVEIGILGQLSHENIVKFYGFSCDEQKMYMFMELLQGSIKDKIDSSGYPIPEKLAKRYTKDLLQGLVCLHANNMIHRDIKCANVLLDSAGTAKLADMGISKKQDGPTIKQYTDENPGTFFYLSPEVFRGRVGGKRSDVWSVGCTVYEMVKGKPPFMEELSAMLGVVLMPEITKDFQHKGLIESQAELGTTLQSFLLKIFVTMEDRPFADQITDHPWIRP